MGRLRAGPGRDLRPGPAKWAQVSASHAGMPTEIETNFSPADRLAGAGPGPAPPGLDDAPAPVVEHAGGPLLVLAGPAPARRPPSSRPWSTGSPAAVSTPAAVLVLTFSRKAAQELRERITLRLDRTTTEPLALTFHSYAYALVRRESVLAGETPPILLSGPEQLLEVRRMLRGEASDGAGTGRSGCGRCSRPVASRPSCVTSCSARPSAASDGREPGRAGRQARPRRLGSGWRVPDPVRRPVRPGPGTGLRLRRDRQDRRQACCAARPGPAAGARRLRRGPGRRVPGHRPGPGGAAAPAGRRRPRADRGRRSRPVDLRLPRRRRRRDRAVPGPVPRPGRRPGAVIALRTCRRSGPVLLAASRRVAARLPAVRLPGSGRAEYAGATRPPGAVPGCTPTWARCGVVIAASERRKPLSSPTRCAERT